MKYRVLIPDCQVLTTDVEEEAFGKDFSVAAFEARHWDGIPPGVKENTQAILLWHELVLDLEALELFPNLKVVVRIGVGTDNVDITAAENKGVVVCNVPDYGTDEVADHAMALCLHIFRGLGDYERQLRRKEWTWQTTYPLRRLTGSKFNIIGLGRIGTAVAMRAKAFGCQVGFFDPYKPDGYDKALGLHRYETIDDLLGEADVVSLHTPLTPETKHLADEAFFSCLKSGAVFVNTARGRSVDLDAMTRALESGKLHAAGLDVLSSEPPDWQHPLIRDYRKGEPWLRGRLVLTPHSAFYSSEANHEIRRKAALEAKGFLETGKVRNRVV